jgi:hypothetical protein
MRSVTNNDTADLYLKQTNVKARILRNLPSAFEHLNNPLVLHSLLHWLTENRKLSSILPHYDAVCEENYTLQHSCALKYYCYLLNI